MNQLLAEYWYLLAIALVIGLVVAWYLFRSTRRTKVTGASRGDVLDEGAQKAQRNSALVDAPPAAIRDPQPVATPAGLAGTGAAVAASAEVGQVGVSAATPEPVGTGSDDLTRIKGVGPKLAARLSELGVTSFSQIAAWNEADIERIDAELGRFQGRIRRDDWVGQAGLLATGDTAEFQNRYGAGA